MSYPGRENSGKMLKGYPKNMVVGLLKYNKNHNNY